MTKKRKHAAPSAKSAAAHKGVQPAASNMFETLWARRKFDILGKKQKGEGKRIGQLRSRAIEKRKKTILQEYKHRHKSNAFVDHRFGEDNEEMSEDEKAILRFQRERQAQLQRKNKFVLPDVEDEEDILTHKGAALSTLDDFKDDVSGEDDDEPHELDAEAVRELNFGGEFPEKGKNRKEQKSKKEVMEEIIAKSKYHKALKAKEKEEDLGLKETLDKEFTALVQTPALLSLVRPKKMNALKALFAKVSSKDDKRPVDINDHSMAEKERPDEYDKLMKEMVFEIRAHASDRLKTPEEIAKEEKERLEELENKRKQRMVGSEQSDSEDDLELQNDAKRSRRRKRTEISGDDLGDDFVLEEEYQGKGWVDEVLARTDGNPSGSSDPDEDEDGADEDDDGADGEDDDGADGEDEDDEDVKESYENGREGDDDSESDQDLLDNNAPWESSDDDIPKKRIESQEILLDTRKQSKQEGKKAEAHPEESGELPFVIDAPQNLEELRLLVGSRSIQDLEVAIQRIRTCNSISLAAENRKKMQIFYNVLLLYFSEVAGRRPLSLARLNALTRPLIQMSSETPYFAAVCARERLIRMQKQLSEKLRSGGSSSWPSVRTLLLLRLWSLIFPGSDFRHVVMTPLMLLMGEYLLRCPVSSGRDAAVGSFLCSLALSIMRHGRRLCPEALNFLLALLSSGLADHSVGRKHCPHFLKELVANQPWLRLKDDNSVVTLEPLNFTDVMEAEDCSAVFDSDTFRLGVLSASLQTLRGFISIYDDIISFPELFTPFLPILLELSMSKKFPASLKASLADTAKLIKEKVEEHERFRQPLRMRLKKPTPIKQFNPKFEEDYVKGRDYDIDRERAEKKKLLRKIKREEKGAARELRKDNQFLAAEKARETIEGEQEREDKYRKAMAFLEEQEARAKSGQLGRKRRKRR